MTEKKGHGLSPQDFFELNEEVMHLALFDGIDYVWEAIKNIEPYVQKFLDSEVRSNKSRMHELSTVSPHATIEGTAHLGRGSRILAGTHILGDVYIGEHTVVGPNVTILGNNIIGDYCEIRPNAFLRGNAIIGDYAIVGGEVKNAYIMEANKTKTGQRQPTAAAHFCYVGDSILGRSVNLGAGTKLSNVKVFWTEITLKVADVHPVGFKFGCILGDYAQTACNVVTAPGTLIGKHSRALVDVGGFIPPRMFVKKDGMVAIDEAQIGETLEGRI